MASKLNITRKEFLHSFKEKYKLYCEMQKQKTYPKERRLILFYSVECGLKSWIMKNEMLNDYYDLEKYARKKSVDVASHNIKEMLKDRNMERYLLKDLKTSQGVKVHPKDYNQFWRYAAQSGDPELEDKMEKVMGDIAGFLYKRM